MRLWVAVGFIITIAVGCFALVVRPDPAGIHAAFDLLPWWMLCSALVAGSWGFIEVFKMAMRREPEPLRKIISTLTSGSTLVGFASLLLAGANMVSFLLLKPVLADLVSFNADRTLAELEFAIFGVDPWRALQWMGTQATATYYHKVWFAGIILTCVFLLTSRESRTKTNLILTYFLLWCVVGPAIHLLMPAAGPIFCANLGLGDRFADIPIVPITRRSADYLWRVYQSRTFGPGAGISAMPSMHIAMCSWICVVSYLTARRWLWAAILFGLSMWLLSVALGWHYVIDGLVGAIMAPATYLIVRESNARNADRTIVLAPVAGRGWPDG